MPAFHRLVAGAFHDLLSSRGYLRGSLEPWNRRPSRRRTPSTWRVKALSSLRYSALSESFHFAPLLRTRALTPDLSGPSCVRWAGLEPARDFHPSLGFEAAFRLRDRESLRQVSTSKRTRICSIDTLLWSTHYRTNVLTKTGIRALARASTYSATSAKPYPLLTSSFFASVQDIESLHSCGSCKQ